MSHILRDIYYVSKINFEYHVKIETLISGWLNNSVARANDLF